jgi:galactonate dehydratase
LKKTSEVSSGIERRSLLKGTTALLGLGATNLAAGASSGAGSGGVSEAPHGAAAPLRRPAAREIVKITGMETLLVKPRWLFLKIHTNAGITGLGEPITEGRALTCAQAVKEVEPYLIGKDPRAVAHHWQAIYRHAFYRGGPILTSALSGIDQALWDIKGKALGVPVYELLGGPTREKIRVYAHAGTAAQMKERRAQGFTAFKTGPARKRPARIVETKAFVDNVTREFAALREAIGPEADIAIDFHGAIPPQTAKLLIKALEPYQPMFIEEPVNCQNVEAMAEIARGTHLPIATGERIFTKWGFREILEKGAASIVQPDLCHAGGITEVRLIAGMAEAYYAAVAPHNPLGPISLAAGLQLAASIPNFLCQEQVSLGEGYIKSPFRVENGYIPLPTAPGLGIELDEDALANKIGHDWRNPESYDADDGSVVDW